jgi:hypothetical protein
MDGVTRKKTHLIVSGLVLKNEMYSVCFFVSYNLLFTLLLIAKDVFDVSFHDFP